MTNDKPMFSSFLFFKKVLCNIQLLLHQVFNVKVWAQREFPQNKILLFVIWHSPLTQLQTVIFQHTRRRGMEVNCERGQLPGGEVEQYSISRSTERAVGTYQGQISINMTMNTLLRSSGENEKKKEAVKNKTKQMMINITLPKVVKSKTSHISF